MSAEIVIRLLSGLLLIAANAFFVAVEFALTRLRGLELSPEEIDEGGLRRAWELTERLEIHLTGCQLGISSTSVLLGVVAEPALTELIEPVMSLLGIQGTSVRGVSVVVAVVLLNLAHKVWGEQAPTYLGVERPREVARRLAPALTWWSRIMSPIIHLGDGAAKATLRLFGVEITRSWLADEPDDVGNGRPRGRAELKERMARLLEGDVLPEDRRGEILRTLDIGEIPSENIMIPGDEIVWLHEDDGLDTVIGRIRDHGYVRYPVLRTTRGVADVVRIDDVAGVLYVPSLFKILGSDGQGALPDLLAPASFIAVDTVVSDLIDHLQEVRQEMALLTLTRNGTEVVAGMVTISDAFEVIAGEVEDPLDRSSPADTSEPTGSPSSP